VVARRSRFVADMDLVREGPRRLPSSVAQGPRTGGVPALPTSPKLTLLAGGESATDGAVQGILIADELTSRRSSFTPRHRHLTARSSFDRQL